MEARRPSLGAFGVFPPEDEPRFSVRMEFRTATPRNVNDRWDIDNLVKPMLDAMEGVLGARACRGVAQPADDVSTTWRRGSGPSHQARPRGLESRSGSSEVPPTAVPHE